jgi:uncharacterized protein (TIGR02246 family)
MRQVFLITMLILLGLNVQAQEHSSQMAGGSSTVKPAAATGNQAPSGARKDLAKISEQWARAWSARQLDQVMELYAPDAVFLPGTGDRITGRAAIRAAFKTALEINTSNLSVRSIVTEDSGTLAYDSGDYREAITPVSGGGQRELQGNYVVVFRRQPDGKWLIIQHVWTDAPTAGK